MNLYFCKHELLQTVDVREYNLFPSGMELTETFHISADFFVEYVFYWNRIVVPCMYMIEIIISDRKHILKKECRFFSIKFTKDDG